jgi:hypothetical protein
MNETSPRGEYRLEIGGTVMSLLCDPPAFAEFLIWWFDRPSSDHKPHACLDLRLVPHQEGRVLPHSLLQDKIVTPEGDFDICQGLIKGSFVSESGKGRIEPLAMLSQGKLMRVMEQIFYQAFHSARRLSGDDALLIHSSAAIAGGKGFLFVGPSEAGKTTAIMNSSQHHVLGDEMNLIRFTDQGPVLEGTPFNGLFRDKKPGSAPLAAVFLLNQAPEHSLSEIPPAEAAGLLTAEIVPFIGLEDVVDPDTVPRLVDAASRLLDVVPVQRLNLLPDPGFWSVIAHRYALDLN